MLQSSTPPLHRQKSLNPGDPWRHLRTIPVSHLVMFSGAIILCGKTYTAVVELRWGPRAHRKDLSAPAKHLFWEGSRGPVGLNGPLEIARWSPINPSLQHLSTHAGVVVFRQIISSDDQTRNHFLMILCAGLQLLLTKSRLLCN